MRKKRLNPKEARANTGLAHGEDLGHCLLATFKFLKALTDQRRQYFPFMKTVEDIDLVRAIGLHQVQGHPASLRRLFMEGIGSSATVHRRLKRLERLGMVHQIADESDRRLVRLLLAPAVLRTYARVARTNKGKYRAQQGLKI